MTIKRRSGSSHVEIANIRRRSGSSWVVPTNVYRRSGSTWVKVWPTILPLTASITGEALTSVPNGDQSVWYGSSVSGGTGGYTYSWSFAASTVGIYIEGGTTSSGVTLRSSGTNRGTRGTLTLVVRDSAGTSVTTTFDVEIWHGVIA